MSTSLSCQFFAKVLQRPAGATPLHASRPMTSQPTKCHRCLINIPSAADSYGCLWTILVIITSSVCLSENHLLADSKRFSNATARQWYFIVLRTMKRAIMREETHFSNTQLSYYNRLNFQPSNLLFDICVH